MHITTQSYIIFIENKIIWGGLLHRLHFDKKKEAVQLAVRQPYRGRKYVSGLMHKFLQRAGTIQNGLLKSLDDGVLDVGATHNHSDTA